MAIIKESVYEEDGIIYFSIKSCMAKKNFAIIKGGILEEEKRTTENLLEESGKRNLFRLEVNEACFFVRRMPMDEETKRLIGLSWVVIILKPRKGTKHARLVLIGEYNGTRTTQLPKALSEPEQKWSTSHGFLFRVK